MSAVGGASNGRGRRGGVGEQSYLKERKPFGKAIGNPGAAAPSATAT